MRGSASIRLELEGFWRAGTGRGSSGLVDELCARDRDGLPYLPGRSLKGVLRDAVERAEAWGWYQDRGHPPPAPRAAASLTRRLFGQIGFERIPETGRLGIGAPIRLTSSGCLAFTSARLPTPERAALARQPQLTEHLFATLATTAVDPNTGTALDKTLRTQEVAIPLVLEATVSTPVDDGPQDWQELLALAFPLVRAIGSGRSRGLGRCRLSIAGEDQA